MSQIKLLPEDVVEKIAAGEIVERPSSVVKELVENALDAGAHKITVKFEDGGINYIEVSDDGAGMSQDDMKMAIKRHATSKISKFDDLSRIMTMGFRGEALPVIASVSRMEIISRRKDSDEAFILRISGGGETSGEPQSRDVGTTVRVESLFYNVPARRKFLKSAETERRYIILLMETVAIARPDVFITVKDGSRSIFELSASSLKERFVTIAGRQIFDKLIDLKFSNPLIKLNGFITNPAVSFANKNKIYIFVNKRPIHSPLIFHAIASGYRQAIQPKRYPACILNIEINPELVDVNVHPAKKEVRFVNQQGIHSIVSKVIETKLSEAPVVMEGIDSPPHKKLSLSGGEKSFRSFRKISAPPLSTMSIKNIDLRELTKFTFTSPVSESRIVEIQNNITVHFQFNNKYVIGCDDGGLIVIDQHTAWERINYEQLKKQYKKGKIASQGSLIPEIIEFKPSLSELVSARIKLLERFGLYIEEFGPNTFKVTGVPAVGGKADVRDMIEDILDIIEVQGKEPDADDLNDEVIKLIACKASLKAGEKMNGEEIKLMAKKLYDCDAPHRCPHGRPVIIRITEQELDKKFLR